MSSPDFLITRPGGSATSVKTVAGVASWDGIYGPAPFRGQDTVVPGKRGQTFNAKDYDAYTFPVPLILLGSSQADFQDKLRTLQALLESSTVPVTASRVVGSSGGDITQTCSAQARVGEVGMVNGLLTGRVNVEVSNLDGCWYGPAATPTIPATITVAGTGKTNRMTLVLPGAGTLTNTTLGVSVVVAGAGTLTVQTKVSTTTALPVAAGDPLGNWFTLAPGSNVITWSAGGTPTISYQAAYQ